MRLRIARALVGLLVAASGPASVGWAQTPVAVQFAPSLGLTRGAGNTFLDLAMALGATRGSVELRFLLGTLAFSGGCAAIVPTKCGAGDGRYWFGVDVPLGGARGFLRAEVFVKHLFDDTYEAFWDEKHRQIGVRLGIGLGPPR